MFTAKTMTYEVVIEIVVSIYLTATICDLKKKKKNCHHMYNIQNYFTTAHR